MIAPGCDARTAVIRAHPVERPEKKAGAALRAVLICASCIDGARSSRSAVVDLVAALAAAGASATAAQASIAMSARNPRARLLRVIPLAPFGNPADCNLQPRGFAAPPRDGCAIFVRVLLD